MSKNDSTHIDYNLKYDYFKWFVLIFEKPQKYPLINQTNYY